MKAKTYEQMSKADLIEVLRNKDSIINDLTQAGLDRNKQIWELQTLQQELEKSLKREKTERDNYYSAFDRVSLIALALANKVENQ